MFFGQRGVVEAEFGHHAGAEIFEQDVGGQRELACCCLVSILFQVEHDRALVAVDGCEILAVTVEDRRPLPHQVAFRRLDLDDIGAHVGEQATRKRSGQHLAELDNAYTL